MPEANNESQRFCQNLIDIGFGEEMIAHCVLPFTVVGGVPAQIIKKIDEEG